jgi:hypothetical protein
MTEPCGVAYDPTGGAAYQLLAERREGPTVEGSTLGALLDRGPLTEEGLFLLMVEMMEAQNQTLNAKVEAFKQQTRIQQAYQEFRKQFTEAWNARVRLNADGDDEKEYALTEASLLEAGFDAADVAAIMAYDDNDNGLISVGELTKYLNAQIFSPELFGSSADELHVSLDEQWWPKDMAGLSPLLDVIDRTREANTEDTTLLTTELSSLVNELNKLSSMFSNMLAKMNESQMAIIRNI